MVFLYAAYEGYNSHCSEVLLKQISWPLTTHLSQKGLLKLACYFWPVKCGVKFSIFLIQLTDHLEFQHF